MVSPNQAESSLFRPPANVEINISTPALPRASADRQLDVTPPTLGPTILDLAKIASLLAIFWTSRFEFKAPALAPLISHFS